jgi:DNA invertase Pin-like site-specific DNA recombinase
MKLGYGRVSTINQNLDTQEQQLLEVGVEKKYIFMEKVTGTSTAPRKELKNLLSHIREGDTVYVTKIDRLARSIIDLNKIVKEINEKGANVFFIKENIEFAADNNANPLQTLLFNLLGAFAQFERDIIVERTKEGRVRAISQGKHIGRPGQSEKNIKRAIELYKNRETNGLSVNEITKQTGVPRTTLYHEIRKLGEIPGKTIEGKTGGSNDDQ